ncbi:DUF6283 family protein [Mycolicibacterium chlorophenolicum]|uniref:Uncharacterized protein n=1 Tax=Mycolicibacterium chlorophenolicum TaxID=37916 RepID=A0A0J6WKC8_9MYCO|nr:DUF6283 family protein [Mycolicibacterium chlorophenolicum]KMO82458.1 hypothetical protein MCHLDSM_01081 [Mycolicibacterium chlorophenolicum]
MWAASEYVKSAAYDRDTAAQPPEVFLCHKNSPNTAQARLCVGWAGCHGDQLLALRLAGARRDLPPEVVRAAMDYVSSVPLFDSGAAAAQHGVRDLAAPGRRANAVIDAIVHRRPDVQ